MVDPIWTYVQKSCQIMEEECNLLTVLDWGWLLSLPFWSIFLSDARLALGANRASKTASVFHFWHPLLWFSPFAPFSRMTSAWCQRWVPVWQGDVARWRGWWLGGGEREGGLWFIGPPPIRDEYVSEGLRYNKRWTHILLYDSKTAVLSDANCQETGRLRNHRGPLDLGVRSKGWRSAKLAVGLCAGARHMFDWLIYARVGGGQNFGFAGYMVMR